MRKKILIVEDELIVAGDLRLLLERSGYEVCGIARSVQRAREMLPVVKPDLVLLDIYLKGDLTGIDLARELNESRIPFVYLSANSNQQVLEAAKLTQPYGFIVKPFREKDVLVTLDIAWYRYEIDLQVQGMPARAPQAIEPLHLEPVAVPEEQLVAKPLVLPNFDGIIGASDSMLDVFELVRQVAPLDTSVLVLGESGTGKEGVAGCIHQRSPRRGKPYVKVNCAALPPNLIESELFGHEKGSFTGALEKRIGKFEKANGGTIFLDEIGEMPADMQVKLLRVLQEREIERIGGNGPIKVDVRVIAATNRNLEKEIAVGNFRLDLYYRLHVFPIEIPALRERPEDIPLLVQHFVHFHASRVGRVIDEIDPGVMRSLEAYHWPGNVRELQNLIERSVLLNKGNVLKEVALPNQPYEQIRLSQVTLQTEDAAAVKTIVEIEREHIIDVLKKCNHRISGPGGAAELLNLPPSTLTSKMKKLGIVKRHTT